MKERKPKGRVVRALRHLAGGQAPPSDSLMHEWSVLPTVAVSCYWIWLYIAYSLDVFVIPADAFVRFDILQKGFGFLGAALFMVAVSLFRTATFFERTPLLSLFSVASGATIVVASALARAGVPVAFPAVLGVWLVMGAGTAAAFLRLFSGLQDAGQARFCAVNALALFLSGFFYLLLLGLQDGIRLVLTVFVVCFTAFMPLEVPGAADAAGEGPGGGKAHEASGAATRRASGADGGVPSPEAGGAAARALLSYRGELFLLSVVFGLAYCLGISLSIMSGSLEFIWLSLCVPGIFLMLYSAFLKERVTVRVLLTFLFPIAAFLLLMLPFSNPFGLVLCCSLLVMCFTTYDVLNVVRLRGIIAANRLPQARSWATGRYPQLVGLVLGWAAGYGMLLTDDALKVLLPAVCVGLVVAIVAMLTRYVWKFSDAAGGAAHASEEEVERAHDAVALRYGLSPREREVMELLVRGYSTERIGRDLHISYHTVKTHVYHIYQKVGVHAQQELIDLVEERLKLMR